MKKNFRYSLYAFLEVLCAQYVTLSRSAKVKSLRFFTLSESNRLVPWLKLPTVDWELVTWKIKIMNKSVISKSPAQIIIVLSSIVLQHIKQGFFIKVRGEVHHSITLYLGSFTSRAFQGFESQKTRIEETQRDYIFYSRLWSTRLTNISLAGISGWLCMHTMLYFE